MHMSPDIETWAQEILSALDTVRQIPRPSAQDPDFDLDDGYAVAARVVALRVARGERPVGWKVGFTNRTIWDEYDVHAPIWGPIYENGFVAAIEGRAECDVARYCEPRIEPEIALRLAQIPDPDMDDLALLGCVADIAHGFEIVQSLYEGWRFSAADTVAGCALHGSYRHGPFTPIVAQDAREWCARLRHFRVALSCNGVTMDEGGARDILGGPLEVLRHLARGLADNPHGWQLRPGDIISTGTVTRAFAVRAGEIWESHVSGLPLEGLRLKIS
jgi:2-keto-4-pentenoate hydratase